jgi:hypothetical protein
MKRILTFFIPWLCLATLSAQSLYELAQKEKQRRARYKGRAVKVVTNADLSKIRVRPAVTAAESENESAQADAPGAVPATPEDSSPIAGTPAPRVSVTREDPSPPPRPGSRGSTGRFAVRSLDSTQNVTDPQSALNGPDGREAMINFRGNLDLELAVRNGPGPDLAVFANRREFGLPNELRNYYVLVKTGPDDWEIIGMGTGAAGEERFELGEVEKTDTVRIIFANPRNPGFATETRTFEEEVRMGIDAVQALH